MAPRNFSFNPSKAAVTGRVYPEGAYELIIGDPKVFLREGQKGENFGIQYPCTIADGEFKGEKYFATFYMHFEGFAGFVKPFQMAALGYEINRADEERFNTDHENDDWDIDFDNKTCGSGWHQFTGKRITANFTVTVNKQNGSDQNSVNWSPAV